MAFLKLIRYKNLIMMAVMMFMMKFCTIDPILSLYGLEPSFTALDFTLLVLSFLTIAAGGYVINDYFDMKTDMINHPETQIVGNDISRGQCTTFHLILSIIGCVFGFLISVRIGFWQLSLIYPFSVGLLWFYSSVYKGMFLVGNLVVAFLIALMPLMPSLYEIRGIIQNETIFNQVQEKGLDIYILLYWGIGYSAFAFLATMVREIVKDMEDVEGDIAQGCRTMPIVIGNLACKIIIGVLIVDMIVGIYYTYNNFLNDRISGFYLLFAVVLPLIYLLVRVMLIKNKKDCHRCNILAKIIMLLGILYLLVAKFLSFASET